MMMKRLAVALWLCASLPVGAQDFWGIHTVSFHAPKRDFNNVNPGVYWRDHDGLQAGILRNSFKRTSLYMGQNFEFKHTDFMVGGALGYPQSAVVPMVAVSKKLNFDYDNGVRLAALGAWSEGKPAVVIHLMYERRWR